MAHRILPKRNGNIFDFWSIIHFNTGVLLGWLLDPFIALVIMVLWEPLEIFVISPFFMRFNVVFGYETIRNSLSDILFDTLGVIVGAVVLTSIFSPPFHLF